MTAPAPNSPPTLDLLDPVPLSGVLVGYGRVSTREQNLAPAGGCPVGGRLREVLLRGVRPEYAGNRQ